MKEPLKEIIAAALAAAKADGLLKSTELPSVILEIPKREEFGDFSTNVAMLMKASEGKAPRDIAALLVDLIAASPVVSRCEVAGPGFINIFLEKSYWPKLLGGIIADGDAHGESSIGKGKKVQVEFVSANPTGPLHIGHGRGAAVGDCLARIMKAAGYDVTTEYYINDVGNQMATLGRSLYHRVRELLGENEPFPDDHYRGEYIKDIARDFITKHGEKYKEAPVEEVLSVCTTFAQSSILNGIRKDLEDFGVSFDHWRSEKDLVESDAVTKTIGELRDKGHVYDKDGATWFASEKFGDDKDRVLVKADGQKTYFASDTAYHREKLERGFDTVVDVWGADHHGYEARIRALIKALGESDERLKVIFIQLVSLLRAGEPVAMSTRAGEFVTLKEVATEVGADACRFSFLTRRSDAHLDFDLELVKKQAPENPVYYVQYCHARIHSILGFAAEQGVALPEAPGMPIDEKVLARLEVKDEIAIIKLLGLFPDVVEKSAAEMEPHRIAHYLQELAGLFHPYYNKSRVVTDDAELTAARILLIRVVASVVKKGLNLLGVSAPEKM